MAGMTHKTITAIAIGLTALASTTSHAAPITPTTDCVNYDTGERWPQGDYVTLDYRDEADQAVGMVDLTGQPCAPIIVDIADPPTPDAVRSLPATGVEHWWLSGIAAVLIASGMTVVAASTRR